MRKTLPALVLLALAACSAPPPQDAAFVAPPRDITGTGMFVAQVRAGASAAEIAAGARAQCRSRNFCKLFAWPEGVPPPGAFPMLDRELASEIYSYSLNRTTGYEAETWDCARFPTQRGKPGSDCGAG